MNQSILGLIVGVIALAVVVPFAIVGFKSRLQKFRNSSSKRQNPKDPNE